MENLFNKYKNSTDTEVKTNDIGEYITISYLDTKEFYQHQTEFHYDNGEIQRFSSTKDFTIKEDTIYLTKEIITNDYYQSRKTIQTPIQ